MIEDLSLMFGLTVTTILLLMIHQGQARRQAKAVLYGDNSMNTAGTLTFTQNDANSAVEIAGTLSGLNISAAHGFHVHVNPVSDGNPNCTAAGGHFNPYNVNHGPRTGTITTRHVGDLGNLTTDANGQVSVSMTDSIIDLFNATRSILDRTVIVHRMRDDGGMGGFSDSTTTGNAGARIYCGIIKLTSNSHRLQSHVALPLLFILFVSVFH